MQNSTFNGPTDWRAFLFCLVMAFLLLANTLFEDNLLLSYGFDRKVLAFNLAAVVCVLTMIILLALHTFTPGLPERWILFFTAYIVFNYYYQVGRFDNFLSSIVLTAFLFTLGRTMLVVYFRQGIFALAASFSILTIGIIENAIGVLQLFGRFVKHGQHISGTFHNSGIYAIYTTSILLFAVGIYSAEDSIRNLSGRVLKALSLICILSAIVIVPSTNSRTSWLAITGGLTALFFIRNKGKIYIPEQLKRVLFPSVFLAGIALLVTLYYFKKDSADGRLVIWKTSFLAIQDNPLTGFGFGQMPGKFSRYQANYFQSNPEAAFRFSDTTHYIFNDALQLTVENGLIGLVLGLGMMLVVMRNIFKSAFFESYRLGAIAGMTGLLIAATTSYPFQMISPGFLFFFFAMLALPAGSYNSREVGTRLGSSFFLMFVFVLTSFLGFYQYKIWKCKQQILTAKRCISAEDFDCAVAYYEKALKILPGELSVLPGYGLAFLKLGKYQESIVVMEQASRHMSDYFLFCNLGIAYTRIGSYGKAADRFRSAIEMMPNRMYPRFLLANMLRESGNLPEAEKVALEIVGMPVKIESSATRSMREDMKIFLKSLGIENDI